MQSLGLVCRLNRLVWAVFPITLLALCLLLLQPGATSAGRVAANPDHNSTAFVQGDNDPVQLEWPAVRTAAASQVYLPLVVKPAPTPSGQRYVIFETFSSTASGWYQGDDGAIRWSYQAGEYEILLRNSSWSGWVWRAMPTLETYSLQADVRNASGTLRSLGLLFDLVAPDRFYAFTIGSDGVGRYYSVIEYAGNGYTYVMGPVYSEAIKPLSEVNLLRVERTGSSITVYANGQYLAAVSDSTYSNGGVGLFASVGTGNPAAARYDNFLIDGYRPSPN